jgi:hypothetical protein
LSKARIRLNAPAGGQKKIEKLMIKMAGVPLEAGLESPLCKKQFFVYHFALEKFPLILCA